MDRKRGRIAYLGTPEISAALLSALVAEGFDVVGVVTRPDAPKGRGEKSSPSPVGRVALQLGLPLHRPEKLNRDYAALAEWKPDLLLTFAYGQILSSKVLALSKLPPLNVHASLLPKLRGASPIQSALLEGDVKTGVCLMEMAKEMDAGKVYAKAEIDIRPEMNFTSLEAAVCKKAIELVVENLPLYLAGKLSGVPQDESKATYCHPIEKRDMWIDLSAPPSKVVDLVRAFSCKPGAYVKLEDGQPLKILQVKASSKAVPQGRLVATKDGLFLGLREGSVEVSLLQRAGKKPCDGSSYANGMGKGRAIMVVGREKGEEGRHG